jgi:hypothetical protein
MLLGDEADLVGIIGLSIIRGDGARRYAAFTSSKVDVSKYMNAKMASLLR